jgi:glycosyltransferase involved in cell wall biosynthesis
MPTALFTVSNDIFTDQRVNKMARTLHEMGFRVKITGVKRPYSQAFKPPYASIKRLSLPWQTGPLFYASLNVQLFFHLLFGRFDLLVVNDLDTLAAGHLAARIRRKPLVYDTHEYFTGTPEVMSRPKVYRVWKWLEDRLFPAQQTIITVNPSIAALYKQDYHKDLFVVRNVPPYRKPIPRKTKDQLGIPEGKAVIILQGTGINTDRGTEELIEAMRPGYGLSNVVLFIIGGGNAIGAVKAKVEQLQLADRIHLLPRMPYEDLFDYTIYADIGVSLDKDIGLNYRYSLPNKLFDYIMAGTPVLVSDLPEVSHVVDSYHVGEKLASHDPAHIAAMLKAMLENKEQMAIWKANCLAAAKELCWEKEKLTVEKIYRPFFDNLTAK